MTKFLATVDGKVDWAVKSYAQVRNSHKDIHFLPPELFSWHELAQFNDVDERLKAVADRENQDDDDKDGGDEMLSFGPRGCPR